MKPKMTPAVHALKSPEVKKDKDTTERVETILGWWQGYEFFTKDPSFKNRELSMRHAYKFVSHFATDVDFKVRTDSNNSDNEIYIADLFFPSDGFKVKVGNLIVASRPKGSSKFNVDADRLESKMVYKMHLAPAVVDKVLKHMETQQ